MSIQKSLKVSVPTFWGNEIKETYIRHFRLFEFVLMMRLYTAKISAVGNTIPPVPYVN